MGQTPPRESVSDLRDRIRKERIKDDMGFSLRWQWELACSDATPIEKLTGMMLRLFGDADGSNNSPAVRTLHAVTGLAESTLKIALTGLEGRHLAEKTTPGAGRRPNTYTLVVPLRTLAELSVAMGAGSEPTIGQQSHVVGRSPANGSQPTTGQQSRSRPIDERSKPTTGYDLDRPSKRERVSSSVKGALPANWRPSSSTITWALNGSICATQAQIDNELEAFIDHAKAHARKQADWDAAFKSWMRKWVEFRSAGGKAKSLSQRGAEGTSTSYWNYNDGVDR